MYLRTLAALRSSVSCVAVIACVGFVCGVLMAVVDAIGVGKAPALLSAGLSFAQFGVLFFGLPTAIVSGIVVWLTHTSPDP
jgi:hypothetical protein